MTMPPSKVAARLGEVSMIGFEGLGGLQQGDCHGPNRLRQKSRDCRSPMSQPA